MQSFQLGVWLQQYRVKNELGRKLLAEFAATTLLMYVGFSVGSQNALSRGQLNSPLGVSIGWGLALIFAVQMAFNISGAHLNPAISLSAWAFGQMSFVSFVLYSIIQTLASFFAAALTFVHYFDKINEFDGGVRQVYGVNATAGLFTTFPGEHLSLVGSIVDQTLCTLVLTFIVGIVGDSRNNIPKFAQPTMYGLMLIGINLAFGLNAGNAMNPARDFGPRLFTLLAGYGWEVFSHWYFLWFLVPIVCPLVGGLAGSVLYQLIIGVQMPIEEETNETSSSTPSRTNTLSYLVSDSSKSTLNSLV
ncbi:Major intrinsic protein domain containing protein [Aphelenchoides bicaudatus]|nr:Major intrinsic protein domain containing protein [Aphelenchoides bicaudatus]